MKNKETLRAAMDRRLSFLDERPSCRAAVQYRIAQEEEPVMKKKVSFVLTNMLPKKLAGVVEKRLKIPEEKNLSDLTKEERHRIISGLKEFSLTLLKTRGFKEAIITQGGISVKEINPSTMEAKCVPSLYVCGEVLDVDAFTGGFNLQIAFSTGYLAGISIS